MLTRCQCLSASTLMMLASLAQANIVLPSPTGLNAAQYGDFYSYSLPYLNARYDYLNGGGVGPGAPWYVDSTPGAIKDLVVVGTGANGNPVNTNAAGMDDALSLPNKAEGDTGFASFAGLWHSSMAAMMGFLAGMDPVFFFNNNQLNSGNCDAYQALSCQNLLGEAQVILTGPGNAVAVFDFVNNGGAGPIFNGNVGSYSSGGVWGANPHNDYILSGGEICYNADFSAFHNPLNPLDCDGAPNNINHNLGANQAAYAIWSPELAAAMYSGHYTDMYIDVRMLGLNNGYEQIFMDRMARPTDTSEPAPLALLLAGGLLLGMSAHRRKAAI